MNRNLKALGLALFAALALGALGAGAAAADVFVSEVEDTVLTSTGEDAQHAEHEFTYGIGSVRCKVVNFAATQKNAEATEVTITPTYDECEFLEEPAVVRTNHCGYIGTGETTEHEGQTHARIEVDCETEGEHIEVETPSLGHCSLTIGEQISTNGATYTGLEDGTITVDLTADVEVTRDNPGSNFFCGLLPASGTGTYHGASIVRGYRNETVPSTAGAIVFTGDETATTEDRGITHWTWGEGKEVDIEVKTT